MEEERQGNPITSRMHNRNNIEQHDKPNAGDWNTYLQSIGETPSYNLGAQNNNDKNKNLVLNSDRDFFSNFGQYYNLSNWGDADDDDEVEANQDSSSNGRQCPNEQEISKRISHREGILNETVYHRSVHPHNGMTDTGRNIVFILCDRQRFSARAVTLQQKRLIRSPHQRGRRPFGCGDEEKSGSRTNSPAVNTRLKDGERSPSTVFESPVSTTQTPDEGGSTLPSDQDEHSLQQHYQDETRQMGQEHLPTSEYPLDALSRLELRPQGDYASTLHRSSSDSLSMKTEIKSLDVLTHPGHPPKIRTSETSFPVQSASIVADAPRGYSHSSRIALSTTLSFTESTPYTLRSQALDEKKKYRRSTYPLRIINEIRMFGEYCLATKYHSAFLNHLGGNDKLDDQGKRPMSSNAVSTISVAFSVDGKTMASTHGDHTVKISCCETGRLLQSLDGHPRTPWTVKYHPINPNIVASGCLGHQVRVWNWPTKTCLQMVRLEFAIISLSFHPSGKLLAIANGTRLHFWGVDDVEDNDEQLSPTSRATYSYLSSMSTVSGFQSTTKSHNRNQLYGTYQPGHYGDSTQPSTNNRSQSTPNQSATDEAHSSTRPVSNHNRSSALTELDQKHMLRCVHFLPNGNTLIIGGVNPNTDHHHPNDPRNRGRGGRMGGANIPGSSSMSFYLRMWDFDLEKALELPSSPSKNSTTNSTPITPFDGSSASSKPYNLNTLAIAVARRAISNPRTFVPRALLYNDGGFDVSPDGKTLCACAEYWLPDGVSNANELLHREELAYEDEMLRKENYEAMLNDKVVSDLMQQEELTNEVDMFRKDDYEPVFNEKAKVCAESAELKYAMEYASKHNNNFSKKGTTAGNLMAGTLHRDMATPSFYSTESLNLRGVQSSAYFTRLNHGNFHLHGRPWPFRDGSEPPVTQEPCSSIRGFSSNSYSSSNNLALATTTNIAPQTPAASSPEQGSSFIPLTPPITVVPRMVNLSPPPPPGSQPLRRQGIALHSRRQTVSAMGMEPLPPHSSESNISSFHSTGRGLPISSGGAPPPPPPPSTAPNVSMRPPHPLSYISMSSGSLSNGADGGHALSDGPCAYGSYVIPNDVTNSFAGGRYVPHVVTISLDTDPFPENVDMKLGRSGKAFGAVARGYRPRLGQLLEACPLDVNKASAVTCVKFSPSTDFCLIGYGVREPPVVTNSSTNNTTTSNPIGNNPNIANGLSGLGTDSVSSHPPPHNAANFHPVTAIYRIKGGMTHISTMLSGDDDVNIARFHPDSGHSFVYGTKQGRVRVLSKRPWNFYDFGKQ